MKTRPDKRGSSLAVLWRPALLDHMLTAQKRERDLLLVEAVKIKDLVPLLMKRRNGSRWTREERETLTEQFRALAHLSPYLVVLVLPGSFAVLPVLAWWLDRRRGRRG
ncbi:MAG: hypothetical protein Q8O34_08880 [Rhodocyclaceae bacterium]|nr:hypothetical protein [Rhodocyclaceae bacterium]